MTGLPIAKRGVSQWCSEEAADDIGADRIGRWAAESDAEDHGLTIVGDVEVKRLGVRTDANFRMENDHPTGLPIYIVATYRAVNIGDAGAHGSTSGEVGQAGSDARQGP